MGRLLVHIGFHLSFAVACFAQLNHPIPPNRWTMPGGSVLRTSWSAARPLIGAPEIAWTYEPSGIQVVREPLVNDGQLLVEQVDGRGTYSLQLVDLETGKPLGQPWNSHGAQSTHAAFVGDELVARRGDDELVGLRFSGERWSEAWEVDEQHGVYAPVTDGRYVVYSTKRELVVLKLIDRWPRIRTAWRKRGIYRGHAAIVDGRVFVMRFDERANGIVDTHVLESGQLVDETFIGNNARRIDPLETSATLFPLDGTIVAVYPGRRRVNDQPIHSIGLLRAAGKTEWISSSSLLDSFRAPAAVWRDGCLAVTKRVDMEGPLELRHVVEPAKSLRSTLTNANTHPRLVDEQLAPSVAGDVLYLGAAAVDLEKQQLLWSLDLEARGRAVPVDDGLLVRTANGALVHLAKPEAAEFETPWPTGELEGARVLTEAGEILVGDALFSHSMVHVGTGLRRELVRRADVLGVIDSDGSYCYAPNPDSLRRAIALDVDPRHGNNLVALADDARQAGALDLAVELLATAREWQATSDDFEAIEKAVHLAWSERPKLDAARREAVQRRFSQERRARLSAWWSARDRFGEDLPPTWLTDHLRWIFAEDPRFPEALAALRAKLPAHLAPEGEFDGRPWMRYLRFSDRFPLRVLTPSNDEPQDPFERVLAEQTESWRPDLHGFASHDCLLVTPLDDPARIAFVLAHGELLTEALRSIFEPEGLEPKDGRPLTILLTESKEEYSSVVGKEIGGRSAGIYLPASRLCALFVREGGVEDSTVLNTFTHEFVHHWIADRCFHSTSGGPTRTQRGYWLVEGIANLAKSFSIDPVAGTWSLDERPSTDLDIVYHASSILRPWDEHFALNQLEAQSSDTDELESVETRLTLGANLRINSYNAFYAQSGATCHYLFHANAGEHRALLVDWIRRYYTGADQPYDPLSALGLEASEFDRVLREHAKQSLGF